MTAILPHNRMPGAEAQAHSQALRAEMARVIGAAGGWIDFAQYMALALYAPGLGYYSAGSAKLGAAGDFITAPEMTPLFALTLAGPIAETLSHIKDGDILEMGAGSGRLAHDLLLALRELNALPRQYHILEVSPELRARQQQTFATLPAELTARITWCDAWPDDINGVVLANEVLDAFPVHRVGWRQDHWVELGVAIENDRLAWSEQPLQNPRLAETLATLFTAPIAVDHYDTEINLSAGDLMVNLGASLNAGCAIFIDYGFPAREYYHRQRAGGTLMCHIRHHAHDDPFIYPGLQDITAHVDFTAVARAALQQGLVVQDYATQASWLIDAGITDHLANLPAQDTRQHFATISAVQKLLSPAEMGELFKVLVLGKTAPSAHAQALLGL
jgi:SAM-dependent MidA family methyltransferase